MAIFKSTVINITDIVADNLHQNIKFELRNKLAVLAYQQIDSIVEEVTKDLVGRIESYHDINGEIKLNIQINKPTKKDNDNGND